MQVGNGSDQFPLGRHSLSFAPCSTNPSMQEWFTTAPNDVSSIIISRRPATIVPIVFPSVGVPGSPQSISAYEDIFSVQTS